MREHLGAEVGASPPAGAPPPATADSRHHTYSELLATKRRGDWEAIVSNASFGAAGAVVITTYYLVRFHRRTKATVISVPAPAGAMLSLTGGF
ncbi:MAG: hypothetical protein HY906_12645 [Deltaproteobacteria bacterium]|nr:hypothetical protein [Deltaproteobacteria bacterium]